MTDAGTEKRQQVTNAGFYLLPLLVGNLVPLVTLRIFTHLLSTEDFGAQTLANAFAVVVIGVASVGLPVAFERNFFQCRDAAHRAQLLYSVVLFTAIAFLISGGAVWGYREWITDRLIGDRSYERVLVWSFWSSAIVAVKGHFLMYLRNSERAREFSAYTIAERLLAAVLAVALVAGASLGVLGLVAGQLLASAVVLCVLVVKFIREHRPTIDRGLLLDALAVGYPLVPRALLGAVGKNVDKYLVGQLSSLGGVGIYDIGQRLANIAFSYMTALQNVFGPQVYSRMFSGKPDAGESIGRYLTPFAYISTLIAFVVAVFSEEILYLLAAPAFWGAVPIVTILTLGMAIQFFGKLPQIAYAKKTHLISLLAVLTTGLTMAGSAAGVWLGGVTGVAWGTLVAGVISVTLAFVIGQRCFRIEWDRRAMVSIFGLLFLSAILTILLRVEEVPYVLRLGVKVTSAAAFLILGAHLQIVTRANIALGRDILLRRRPAP